MPHRKAEILPLLLIFMAAIVSLRTIVFQSGFVFRDDMAFPFAAEEGREALINRFSIWYGKIGGGFDPTLPSNIPFWSMYNVLAIILSADSLNRLLVIMPLIIAGCSMYMFSRKIISVPASLLAAFFYMFNPWTFDHYISGHLNLLMEYALTPIPLIFVFKRQGNLNSKDVIFAALPLALILSFSAHTFALIFFLVALHAAFEVVSARRSYDKKQIRNLVLIFVLPLILNFFWLLPTLVYYHTVSTTMIVPEIGGSIVETLNNQARILNTLRLTGYWLPYFRNSVAESGLLSVIWPIFSLAIPVFSFVPICLKKDKTATFFSVAAITFLIPTIVASYFPNVYLQFINYFQPLALFRDSYKFIAIVCFSYSVLMGKLLETLISIGSKLRIVSARIAGRARLKHIKLVFIYFLLGLLLISTLVYSAPNIISGDFMGLLNAAIPPPYWFQVRDFLANRVDYSRVLWAPPYPSLHYDWYNSSGNDPVDEYLSPVYSVSLKSRNPALDAYLQFLMPLLYGDSTDGLGKFLAPLSIKYIVARLDAAPTWEEAQYPPDKLQEFFERQRDLIKVFESGKWIVYENNYSIPYIAAPPLGAVLLFGNLSTVIDLNGLSGSRLPLVLLMDVGSLSQHDVGSLVSLSNIIANMSSLTVAIPVFQSVAMNGLAEQIKGNTSLMYFLQGKEFPPEEKSVVPNYSFEEGLDHWHLGNDAFSLKLSGDSVEGKNSLQATTDSNASLSWSWISSDDIPVIPDTTYKFSTNMKLSNVVASHIKILGFNNTGEKWQEVCQLPAGMDGTLNWTYNEFYWTSPQDYTKLRVVLNAGWVKDPSKGNATTLFDDINIIPLTSHNALFNNAEALPLYGTAKTEINILKESSYKIGLRAYSAEENGVEVKLYTDSVEQTIKVPLASNSLNFSYSQTVHLNPNNYTLEVTCEKPAALDTLTIMEVDKENETLQDLFSSEKAQAEVVSFRRINPTSYVAEVNATRPFLLTFAETYDPSWVAYVNGQRIESTPLYSVINGFWINQTGQLTITIEYEAQKWFYYGSTISAGTLIAIVAYATYNSMRKKRIWRQRAPLISSRAKPVVAD